MPSEIEILGRIRGGNAPDLLGAGDLQPQVNGRGDVLVAQALPSGTELVRMGASWWTILGTAVAPVVALPTVTSQLSLFNGEMDTGKSYVIDSVFAIVAVSAAAAMGIGLAACVTRGKATKPAAAALTIGTLAGKGTYGGKAVTAINLAITNDGWMPLGSSVVTPVAAAGMVVDVPVNGSLIVPPGGMLNLAGVGAQGASTSLLIGVRWHEVVLALG